ncbi:hypothetical protein U1Q18_006025 [Sarracenia purpurea var. burkii]
MDCEGNEKNAVKILEQALEEEHAALVTIYLDLENERSAAATAVDEAMAMILRLQEEKDNTSNVHRDYDLPLNASKIQRIEVKTDYPSTSRVDTKLDLNRSSTRITASLPSRLGSSGKSTLSEL